MSVSKVSRSHGALSRRHLVIPRRRLTSVSVARWQRAADDPQARSDHKSTVAVLPVCRDLVDLDFDEVGRWTVKTQAARRV